MADPLHVLMVEDNSGDADLVLRELRRQGFAPAWTRVETEADYLATLKPELEVILSDHVLPQFGGPRALELLKERQLDVPFIVISGTIGEEVAVQAIKQGAADYLLKDRLGRLGQAIRQAIEQRQIRREREQTRAQLRETDERFRQVVENIGEVFWMSEPRQQRIVYISPTYARIWGQDPGDLYANPRLWFNSILPEDQPKVAAALPRQLAGGYNVEYRIRRPDGTIRHIHDRAFPVRNDEGAVYRVAGIAEDVTSRLLAEERLRQQAAMLDLAHDAIIVHRVNDQRITYWNRGAERIYGWTAEEAVGQCLGELIHLDDALAGKITSAVREKGEWRSEAQHLTKDGRKLRVNVGATPVHHEDGSLMAILSIATDVTEQRKLEYQFLRAQRMESIGTLASGVAHDLNNILAPILMSVPLLQTDLPAKTRNEIARTIESSAQRGAQIVRQVLAFGRGLEGERKPLALSTSIAELEEIIRGTFPRNIQLEVQVAPELWIVLGDSTQIHQVLLNLCVNARDALPQGGSLQLRARNLEIDRNYAVTLGNITAGRYVVVEVEDDGTGIAPEVIERIFDPFFTTKGLGQGTGLGLSTVLGIVKSHGGNIYVSSALGKGTVFQVYLPCAHPGEVAASPPVTVGESLPRGNGELILIVDDETTILHASKSVLSTHGYNVVCAQDGTEAVAILAQNLNRTAAIVTDLMMPYMDGVALARAIRRMKPTLPLAASTGLGERTHLAELKALGVSLFLQKPYSAAELLKTVHTMLHPDALSAASMVHENAVG